MGRCLKKWFREFLQRVQKIRLPKKSKFHQPPKRITDLNDDCLERIFSELQIKDMLRVAGATNCFQPAVRVAFQRKYGRDLMFRDNSMVIGGTKEIRGLANQLKLLRCFGSTIHRIELCGHNVNKLVEVYIYKYCSNSLLEMEFRTKSHRFRTKIQKTFSNVQKLDFRAKFSAGSFGEIVPNLTELFPELRDLSFYYCVDERAVGCIEQHFPHLERIALTVGDTNDRFKISNLARFLELNEQLKHLILSGSHLLHNHIKPLQFPEHLELYMGQDYLEDDIIYLKNVKFLNISDFRHDYFEFYAEELYELELWQRVEIFQLDKLLEHIIKHPTLRVLKLNIDGEPERNNWKQMVANVATNLNEVSFSPHVTFSVNEVKEFLNVCSALQKFTVKLSDGEKVAGLMKLDNRWNVSRHVEAITLSEKTCDFMDSGLVEFVTLQRNLSYF